MVGNLAALLIKGQRNWFYVEYDFSEQDKIIKLMQKSKKEMVKRNGLRAFAKIYENLKLIELDSIIDELTKFLSCILLNENDIENSIHALTCFNSIRKINFTFLRETGCLTKLISFLRFPLIFLKYFKFFKSESNDDLVCKAFNVFCRVPAEEVNREILNYGGFDSLFRLTEHKNDSIRTTSFLSLEHLIVSQPLGYFKIILENPMYLEKLMMADGFRFDRIMVIDFKI